MSLSSDKQLVAACGSVPFARTNVGRDAYVKYLEFGSTQYGLNGLKAYRGFAYRAFKEAVNRGDGHLAKKYISHMPDELNIAEEFSRLEADARLASLHAIRTFDEYGERFPFFMGPFLYYLGMFNLLMGGRRDAQRFLEAGTVVLEFESDLAPEAFIESQDVLKHCWLNLALLHDISASKSYFHAAFLRARQLAGEDRNFERRCLWQHINFINSSGFWEEFPNVFSALQGNLLKSLGSPSLSALAALIPLEKARSHELAAIDIFDPLWALLLYQLNFSGKVELSRITANEITELIDTPFFVERYGIVRREEIMVMLTATAPAYNNAADIKDTEPPKTEINGTVRASTLINMLIRQLLVPARKLHARFVQNNR
jgi:hypothetical protein